MTVTIATTNKCKYDQAFTEALGVPAEQLNDSLEYDSTPGWDSVGHMTLMASLESVFDIMMETDDIIAFGSYQKGRDILAKYDIQF